VTSEIRRAEEFPAVIETLKDRADALYLQSDPLMNTNRISDGRQFSTLLRPRHNRPRRCAAEERDELASS
jgi:hypothetical protein